MENIENIGVIRILKARIYGCAPNAKSPGGPGLLFYLPLLFYRMDKNYYATFGKNIFCLEVIAKARTSWISGCGNLIRRA
jgi:hypothetical protein